MTTAIVCPDRATWLAKRRKFIGASDTPAILGVGYKNQSAFAVWLDKVEGVEMPVDAATAKRMAAGSLAERFVAEAAEIELGIKIERDDRPTIRVSDELDFVAATIDGWTTLDGVEMPVECKFVGPWAVAEWADGQTPIKHALQVQHQLFATESPAGLLVGWTGHGEPMIRTIERDDALIASLKIVWREFWDRVLTRQPPDADGSEATALALAIAYPDDDGSTVQLPPGAVGWADTLVEVKSKLKALERLKDEIENRIKSFIGDATVGELSNGGSFSWKSQTRAEYVVPEKTFRVLRYHAPR